MLKWQVEAMVKDVIEYEDKQTGEPKAMIKLDYMGGNITTFTDSQKGSQIKALKGRMVSCSGPLNIEERRDGLRISYDLESIHPVK